MTRDLCTLIYLLNLELCEECSRTLGPAWGGIQQAADVCNRGAAVEAGEQQFKRTQSGSSSSSGRNRGAAAGSEGKRGAAVDAAIGPKSSS